MARKRQPPKRSNDEIRQILLHYFYENNRAATSARGSKGVAAKISRIRADLKASHGLTQPEVWSNLTYLISEGWVEEVQIQKSVPLKTGTIIPQITPFYKIIARGIDKIEGPSEFTMKKFHGIKIEATGQNIITVGDGNEVNIRYQDAAAALANLKKSFLKSNLDEEGKLNVVADIDTIQSQLAKAKPNGDVIRGVPERVSRKQRSE
jgi:hypothetical protein